MSHIVVTGCAGFIGFHLCKQLLSDGHTVIGLDNLNDYYDVDLKKQRLKLLESPQFQFHHVDISDYHQLSKIQDLDIEYIVHLAAQAGVRYSLENPYIYAQSNMVGQVCILEWARQFPNLKHTIYASSSSVYGANAEQPFSTSHRTDHPISLYAATKKACEVIAESYARIHQMPITGLRYFTVYGPWGRPDMALFKFTKLILHDEEIPVFNHGKMKRNFTYIDDIVNGTILSLFRPNSLGHAIYNIGNNRSESLMDYIAEIEKSLGKKAKIRFEPMQSGDIEETLADISNTKKDLGFEPQTSIQTGVPAFVDWYLNFYHNQVHAHSAS